VWNLGDDPGLDDGELGVLDGEEEVHEEDDPRHDAQHPHSHTSISIILVLIVLDGDGPDGDEEDAAHQVDEELEDGEVGAHQVGQQHRRHYDRVPDHSALAEEVVVVSAKADGRALGASEPRDHQHDKHQHNF